jgi:hypothetical protein
MTDSESKCIEIASKLWEANTDNHKHIAVAAFAKYPVYVELAASTDLGKLLAEAQKASFYLGVAAILMELAASTDLGKLLAEGDE